MQVASHLELDIRRPNGMVETIVHPQWKQINDRDFAKIVAATKAAGRGDVLAYRNVKKEAGEYVMTAADKADQASERVQKYLNKNAS